MNAVLDKLPESYRQDIQRAIGILTEAGCSDIFLFGSISEGNIREGSDIDIAVRGCTPGIFFHVLGKLLVELHHPVDLVDLDKADDFAQYLEREEELVNVI